jgi:trehalose 6-phosphate phosphatase
VSLTLRPDALAPLLDDPEHAAVLLDIDGTLAPIVEHAVDAYIPEPTRQLLVRIAKRFGLVACVSGRRASDARALVSIGTISYVGSHGAELLQAGWVQPRVDPEVDEWARRIGDFGRELNAADLRRRWVRLEDKGAILAFHWRGAPDEQAARAAIDAIAQRAEAAGLSVHWGRKVLEVRPPVKIDKGAAVRRLLDGSGMQTALYAGDDGTDLDAFRALAHLAAEGALRHVVRVGVRSEEGPAEIVAEADLVVEGPTGVCELLELLAGERPAAGGAET